MSNLLSLPTGTVLVGDYRIERVLGAGGFGITYLALETAVDRYVTIKEYFPTDFAARGEDFAAEPRSQGSGEDYQWGLDRFIDEARTLGKFDHRNIVRLYRYFHANNTAYMVLHFEEGQSLKAWLNSLGRAPRQNELDQLVAPLLDALALIHDADFLHRDIAPDNIIVRKDGSPVLIDFGSARGEIAHHTRTISALVKPGYSPYEQYAETGKKQGPWTDIYAFAGTLYHAVTGRRPADAPSRVIKDEVKPATEAAVAAYRTGFLHAIDRGLLLDIDQRPQSIAAWRGDLLAPSEAASSWFGRITGRTGRNTADEDAAPTRALTEPVTVAPQPDAPAREGEFVDFVDRLKRKNRERDDEQGDSEDVVALEAAEPKPPSTRSSCRLYPPSVHADSDWAGVPDQRVSRAIIWRMEAWRAAVDPNRQLNSLPVPVTPRTPPRIFKSARPRPIRGISNTRWRSMAFKLLIGVGIAAGAVAIQDKLPTIQLRSTGAIASSNKQTPATPAKPGVARNKSQSPPAKPLKLLLHKFRAHDGAITKARFAKSGQYIVTTGADGTMKIWNSATRQLERAIEFDDGPATALATRGDLALSGHSEGVIALWDLTSGIKRKSFKRNDASIWDVAFAGSNDRFWAAAHDWTVVLWETSTPSAPLRVLQGHESAVQAIAYSPASSLLASGGADRAVRLWNGSNLRLVRAYRKTRDFVTALAFSSDGETLVAGTLDGRIRIMSTKSRRFRELRGHQSKIVSLGFATGGRLISAGQDGSLKSWNLRRRRSVQNYAARGLAGSQQTALAVSPNGQRMISADSSGHVQIWNASALTVLRR